MGLRRRTVGVRSETSPADGGDPTPGRRLPSPCAGPPSWSAALAGALCVVLGVVAITPPTLLPWLADERSTASLAQTLGVGIDLWTLAHRAQVATPGVEVVLAPLLLPAVPFLLCWYAFRQIVLGSPHLQGRVPHIHRHL